MDYLMLSANNNAEGQLFAPINASVLSMALNSGDGDEFPIGYNNVTDSAGTSTVLNRTGIAAELTALGITEAGFFIRNIDDGSIAVVKTINTDSLTTTRLKGGTLNTWGDGDEINIGSFVVTNNIRNGSGDVTTWENILIKYRDGDTLYIEERGYNGTSALSWAKNAYVSLFMTESILKGLRDAVSLLIQDKAEDDEVVKESTLTTKGDIFVRTASGIVRLPIGTDGQALIADSTVAAGVKWIAAGGETEFSDSEFGIFSDKNYISTAPDDVVIAEGAAGTNSYTSVKVKVAYISLTGTTEASVESNELTSVINKKINIDLVASLDTGCTGIRIWLDIDGAGYKLWEDAANADAIVVYDNESLTVDTPPVANDTKKFIRVNADDIIGDITIRPSDIPGILSETISTGFAVEGYNDSGTLKFRKAKAVTSSVSYTASSSTLKSSLSLYTNKSSIFYIPAHEKYVVFYGSGGNLYYRFFTVSGTTITWGTEQTFGTLNSSKDYSVKVAFNDDFTKGVCANSELSGAGNSEIRSFVCNPSTESISSVSTLTTLQTNLEHCVSVCNVPGTNVFGVFGGDNSPLYTVAQAVDITSTPSYGTLITIQATGTQGGALVWDSTNSMFAYAHRNASGTICYVAGVSISGTTLTLLANTNVSSTGFVTGMQYEGGAYDPTNDVFFIKGANSTSTWIGKALAVRWNGSSFTAGSVISLDTFNSGRGDCVRVGTHFYPAIAISSQYNFWDCTVNPTTLAISKGTKTTLTSYETTTAMCWDGSYKMAILTGNGSTYSVYIAALAHDKIDSDTRDSAWGILKNGGVAGDLTSLIPFENRVTNILSGMTIAAKQYISVTGEIDEVGIDPLVEGDTVTYPVGVALTATDLHCTKSIT